MEPGATVAIDRGNIDDGVLAVMIAGELDPSTADQVRDQVLELTADHRPGELALDLAGVTFMDSAGVRIIVELHHEQRRRDGRLTLVNVADVPRRVLEISGLTAELERL
jgi:anti-anti-sigma factor